MAGEPQERAPERAALEPEPSGSGGGDVERTLRTCPVCGAELAEQRCKLLCPRPGCGYFLSCADYL